MSNCKMTKGQITIEFVRECVTCQDADPSCEEQNLISVNVLPAEDGNISVYPDGLLTLLVRVLGASLIAVAGGAGKSLAEVFQEACHVSSALSDEIVDFKKGHYRVKINVPQVSTRTDIVA